MLSEAIFLVRNLPHGGEAVTKLLELGIVRAVFRLEDEATAVTALMTKYANVPMDLADACLVRMTETHGDPTLVSVDSEFRDVYRRHGRKVIPTLLPVGAQKSRRKRARR